MVVTKMHILGNICQRARRSYSGAEYGSLMRHVQNLSTVVLFFHVFPVLYRSNFLL